MAKHKKTNYKVHCCINGKEVTVEEAIKHVQDKLKRKLLAKKSA